MTRLATLRDRHARGERLVAEDFEFLADMDGLWTCCRPQCEVPLLDSGKPQRHAVKDCPFECKRADCPREDPHEAEGCTLVAPPPPCIACGCYGGHDEGCSVAEPGDKR